MRHLIILCAVVMIPLTASADSNNWRIALGYAYLADFNEMLDAYKDISNNQGDGRDIYNTSLSAKIHPYLQFSDGYRIGIGVGPLQILTGDKFHIQVPVNITAGYQFFSKSNYSPYVECGISYHINSGDYYSTTLPGFYGSAGIKIFNRKKLHLGLEAAYDGSTTELFDKSNHRTHQIKSGILTIFLYADF